MGFGFQVFNAEAAQKAAEARNKVEKYTRLVTYLEEKIGSITARLEEAEQLLNSQHDLFMANPDSAQGLIITTFDDKESNAWKTQYETIIRNMHMGVGSLKIKKTSAEQIIIYWKQVAEMWEARIYAGF